MTSPDVPIVTLSNGVRVANFSSPHEFKFVDGSVLGACSDERAQSSKLQAIENHSPHPTCKGVVDIQLDWDIPASMVQELRALAERDDIDVVLVPFPVMTALKNGNYDIRKARVIRVADRVSKEIYIDRFCA